MRSRRQPFHTIIMRRSLLFLIFTCLCACVANGQSNGAAALLADAMRQYQVRYRVLNNGSDDVWPAVFNCRLSGMPAPANPSDEFFSGEVEDPERLAELAASLLVKASNNYFLGEFVSNYDDLKSGVAEDVETYSASKLGLSSSSGVGADAAMATLIKIRRAMDRLNYTWTEGTIQDKRIKQGTGFRGGFGGTPYKENHSMALNGVYSYGTGLSTDYSGWQHGWHTYPFRIPHFYEIDDLVNHGNPALGYPRIGFQELETRDPNYQYCYYSETGANGCVTLLPATYNNIRIIKGTIALPYSGRLGAENGVELYLKLDDLGTSETGLSVGTPGLRQPPVKADNRFKFLSHRGVDETWEWSINDQYGESYIPSFLGPAGWSGPPYYMNGWELLETVAIFKPELKEHIDEGISCRCGPCDSGACPAGTPSYSNSSIMISLPLGLGNDHRSAGYLMIHEDAPSDSLKSSAALQKYLANGAYVAAQNEPGVTETIFAPNVRVHVTDDPDANPLTHDWQLEFYDWPYFTGEPAYHRVNFEAVYSGGEFERFRVTETGQLGNRLREYVWKTETVTGSAAQVDAVVENGEVTGFEVIDPGSRYTNPPVITLSGGGGTGASISGAARSGVITAIELLDGGSGYTSMPTVTIQEPAGSGATFQPDVLEGSISVVDVVSGGWGYQSWNDSLIVTDPEGTGSGAVLDANFIYPGQQLDSIDVVDGGSGYSSGTTVTVDSQNGSGASTAVQVSSGYLSALQVTDGGSGYTGSTAIDISGSGSGAEFLPILQNGIITGTTRIEGGGGYDANTTATASEVALSGGAVVTPVVVDGVITDLILESGGSGYTDQAEVIFSGGGSGARSRVVTRDAVLSDFSVDDAGSGYTSAPTVTVEPPAPETRSDWELVYYDTDGTTPLKYEYKRSGTADDGYPAEIVTIRDGGGTVLRETTTSYFEKSYGRQPRQVIESILDASGSETGQQITNFRYYENPSDSSYGLLAEQWQNHNGMWKRFTYDAEGRLLREVEQYMSSGINESDDASAYTDYTYSIDDLNLDGEDEVITTMTHTVLGNVVSRQFEIWWGGTMTADLTGSSGTYDYREKWSIQALSLSVDTPAEAIGAADTLIRKYRYYEGGIHDSKPRSVETPDGQISIYEYSSDGSSTIEFSGAQAAGSAQDVSKGLKQTTLRNEFGNVIAENVRSYPGDLLVEQKDATSIDAFGRVTSWDLKRGTGGAGSIATETYASTSLTYGCCGIANEIDAAGILTMYQYDGLKRRNGITRSGLTTEHSIDALGRIRRTTENGELVRTADYDSLGRLIEEETMFKDSLVATIHAFDRSNPDFDVETVSFPDASGIVRQYFKDGRLYQETGSATLPVRYIYASNAAGERLTTARKLKASEAGYLDSGEFKRSVADMAGRTVRIESPKPSDVGIAILHYDYNLRGQLDWVKDADNVTTHRTYNTFFEPSGSYVNHPATGVIRSDQRDYVYSASDLKVYMEESSLLGDDSSEQRVTQSTPDGLIAVTTQYGLETKVQTQLDGSTYSRKITTTYPDQTYSVTLYGLDGLLESKSHYSQSDSLLEQTSYEYDSRNRLWKSTDLRNGTTTFLYYADGRLKSSTSPDPDASESGLGYDPQQTLFDYAFEPGGGVRTITTLPDAAIQVAVADALGRVALTYGSQINPAAYTYDYAGRLDTLTTWQGFDAATGTPLSGEAVTQWVYNPAGLLQEKRYAVTSPTDFSPGTAYSYTAAGRLLTRAFARGVSSRFQYNGEGLLWKTDHGDDGSFEETTLYDPAGRPETVTDDSGTRSLSYQYGQLADETYTAGTLDGYKIDRSFDPIGRIQGTALKENTNALHQVGYGYHAQTGRLEAVTSGAHSFTYSYHPNSRLMDEVVFNNGSSDILTHKREWDALNRLTTVQTLDDSLQVLDAYTYQHNDLNQRTRATLASGDYWAYSYDGLGQVESARKKDSAGADLPNSDYSYTFDAIGNRQQTSTNGAAADYMANVLNQYESLEVPRMVDLQGEAPPSVVMQANGVPLNRDGEHFYGQIDLSGEGSPGAPLVGEVMIQGTLAGAGDDGTDAVREVASQPYFPPTPYIPQHDEDGNLVDDGRWNYTWNTVGRLEQMETHPLAASVGVAKQKLEFGYDSQGRRFSKTLSSWDYTTENWETGSQTMYFYDGWNLIAELGYDSSSALTHSSSFIWGLDLSGTMQGAGGVDGLLAATDATGSTFYPGYDGNGNVMGYYAADTGERVAEFEYGPFGELIRETGSKAGEFNFRFSTKYEDAETGLLYYGFRYYDPETGRWPSRDPIGEQGGLNLYGFVGNDGVNQWDLLGLDFIAVGTRAVGINVVGGHLGFNHMSIYFFEEDPACTKEGDEFTFSKIPKTATKAGFYELLRRTDLYERSYKHDPWYGKPRTKTDEVSVSVVYDSVIGVSSEAERLIVIFSDTDQADPTKKEAKKQWTKIQNAVPRYRYALHDGSLPKTLDSSNWPRTQYLLSKTATNSNTFIRVLARVIGKDADVLGAGQHYGAQSPSTPTDDDLKVKGYPTLK